LTWPANEQHSGLRGQCREPEVDLEDEPTAAQALEVREQPRHIELATLQVLVDRPNVHDVNLSNGCDVSNDLAAGRNHN
jgi:hypothetical protein